MSEHFKPVESLPLVEAKEKQEYPCCQRCLKPVFWSGLGFEHPGTCEPAEPKPTPSAEADEADPGQMTDAQYEEYIYSPNRAQWPNTKADVAEEDAFQVVENHLFSYKGKCDCRFHKAIKNNTISTSPDVELAKADDCLHLLMGNRSPIVKDKATAAHVLIHDLAAILSSTPEIRDSYQAQPDSSSISTEPMPEQLVSDELIELRCEWDEPSCGSNKIARELQQWRKWAKGAE